MIGIVCPLNRGLPAIDAKCNTKMTIYFVQFLGVVLYPGEVALCLGLLLPVWGSPFVESYLQTEIPPDNLLAKTSQTETPR